MLRSFIAALIITFTVATPAVAEQSKQPIQVVTAEDDERKYRCKSRATSPRSYLETVSTVDEPSATQATVQKKGKNGCGIMPVAAGLGLLAILGAVGGSSDNTQ